MKILTKRTLCVFLLLGLVHLAVNAQSISPVAKDAETVKPALFSDLPDSIQLDAKKLHQLVNVGQGSTARIDISPDFYLLGTIISVSQSNNPPLNSVVLRASNRLGAVFTLTRIAEENGAFNFQGRVASRRHSDAYELVPSGNAYLLVKRGYSDLNEE